MTFFGRMLLQKAAPYHDASGKFTSAGNAGGTAGKGLPNGKHHGDNAYAAVMNTLQTVIPEAAAFKTHRAAISQVVEDSLSEHKNCSSASKAQEIWVDLKNMKSVPDVSWRR